LPHTTVISPSSTPKTTRSYVETPVDRTQRLTLFRYRAMAYVVGVGLLVLVGVGVPLQYLANEPAVVSVVGPIHGFLYIVYLLSVADLARRFRLGLGSVIALVAAGFVPFLAFVVERRVTRRIEEQAQGPVLGAGEPEVGGPQGVAR
jgi:integral membrane protein